MNGKCLCGSVQFRVRELLPHFYQCHCSLCRKISGSASDTATFLNKEHFTWVKGEDVIRSYKTETGYRHDFCSQCGSTVPHLMESGTQYWVPAGLLDDAGDSQVAAHLFVGSRASWDTICGSGTQFEEMPAMETLNNTLQRTNR